MEITAFSTTSISILTYSTSRINCKEFNLYRLLHNIYIYKGDERESQMDYIGIRLW